MNSHRINRAALTIFVCLSLLFLTDLYSSAQGLELKSPAFVSGSMIPSLYTCQGKNISPHLTWSGAPAGTKSFVLICDDPDAPILTWVHWVYYNIPASVNKKRMRMGQYPFFILSILSQKLPATPSAYGHIPGTIR